MIQEAADLFELLKAMHTSIDKMVEDVQGDQWLTKPLPNFNNVASVIDHITRVERKFFSAIAGEALDIDTGAPFRDADLNVEQIRHAWAESIAYAEQALSGIRQEELSEPGLKLGIGELNKRQLISYAIAHTAHHRGQIPLIKKLLG